MAKIPVILEAGRADGKLIKTNNVYDDNQEKFLSEKIKEIDYNHNDLKDGVNALTEVVNTNKSNIENKLEAEKIRATNVENNLRETINNITGVNENATTANIVTIDTLPNSTASNVQQALDDLYKSIIYDVSARNGGVVFESLSVLLSSSNLSTLIPTSVRHGGMIIKFIQSSDNKYVQYRYFGTTVTGSSNPFLDVTNWVGKTIGVSDSPAVNEFIKELYILPDAEFTYQDVKRIYLGFDDESRIIYFIDGDNGNLIKGTIDGSTSHNGVYLLNNKVYIAFNNLDIELHKTLTLNVQCSILDMNPTIKNYINGNEIARLKTRTDNIDSYINNKGVSNNRDINIVIDEFYIGSDAGFTYQDVKSITLDFDDESRIIYFIDGDNGNLIKGTIDDSTSHNGVYQLGNKDVYIAFNNLTAIRRTELTLNSRCGVLSCNPRVSAYKNKKYININTSDIEGIKNFISDEKISNKDSFNEVVAELYIDASVAGFSYDVPNSISVTVKTNMVQVWFYNGSTRLAADTIYNPQIYTVYKVVNGIYIVLKKIAASGIATALTQRCGSIVANDKIYSYFNKQSITAIENDITRVYTANNNVLWLGTSISEGGRFPQTACAANHYNCIKKAVSASCLNWNGVKPSYPLSWHSCLHLTITQTELETMFREDVTNGLLSEELLDLWKNNVSYEGCLMPYINGTNPTQVSMIVIEHGYNDRGICHSQMQDAENINWDSENRSTFTGSFRYLINRIQEVNPFIKIVIAGHFTNTVIGTYNPSTHSVNRMYTKDICDLQSLISKYYNIPILKIWEHSQIGNYYVSSSANYISEFNTQYSKDYPKLQLVDNNYDPINSNLTSSLQMYCPDGVHPNSDLSGNSEQRLDGIYTKLLKNII